MPNEPNSTTEEIKAWDIAPGVGVGRKWVNKKGWTFEYMIGLGRYLFANSGNDDVVLLDTLFKPRKTWLFYLPIIIHFTRTCTTTSWIRTWNSSIYRFYIFTNTLLRI